ARAEEEKAGRKYRLPTEEEWEYACRGSATNYHVFGRGDSLSSKEANFRGTEPYGFAAKGPWLERTCKVGSYKPNGFGLYDMHGNVWEWCANNYAKDDEAIVRKGGCWARRAEIAGRLPAGGGFRMTTAGTWGFASPFPFCLKNKSDGLNID